jgi:hypothetical protein
MRLGGVYKTTGDSQHQPKDKRRRIDLSDSGLKKSNKSVPFSVPANGSSASIQTDFD